MATVGIRELKAHLSAYLAKVKAGEVVVITERGKPIGRLSPEPGSETNPDFRDPAVEAAWGMVRDGKATWSGRKFVAPRRRIPLQGTKLVSDIVIEDRGER